MSDEKAGNKEEEKQEKGRCCGTKKAFLGIGALLASLAALCACGCGDGKKDAGKGCCS